jgi:hypothetical protein
MGQVLLRHMAGLNSPAIFDGGRGSRRFRRVVSQNESRAIVDDRNTTWYLNGLLMGYTGRNSQLDMIVGSEIWSFSIFPRIFEVCQMHSILLRKLNQVFFACFVLLGNGLEMNAILIIIKRG